MARAALLVIFLPVFFVQASRIRDRFNYHYIKRKPLRIVASVVDDAPQAVNAVMDEYLANLFRKANFTFQRVASLSVGYQTSSGQYNNFLGQLIENKSDVAIMGTVLSSFNFPGLVPLQVGCGVSLKVHSQVALELKEPSDVLSSIEQLPLEFKILLFVAVHIVAGSIMGVMDSSLQYLKTFWTTLRCFVGQTDWNVESTRNRVLWWHFNVFAFVAIYGYVLNVMSTDTFVMKQPRRIERFEDAFDPYFKKVRFYMMKNSFFFNTMRDADENTIMGKVFKKLNQTSDCSQLSTCSFLEINGQLGSTNHQETLQLLRNVSERGGGANFMANELVENFVIPGMCRTQPDMIDKVYTAPKALAEDILVNFMREDVDRNVVVYLRHIFASVFESGYFWVSMQESIHSTLDVMGSLDRDFNYLSCCMRRQPEVDDVIIQSGPIVYRRLGVLTGSLILVAVFLALAERSTSKRLKRCRRKKLVNVVRNCLIRA